MYSKLTYPRKEEIYKRRMWLKGMCFRLKRKEEKEKKVTIKKKED